MAQNTTFGGIQGFSRRPSTQWIDDDGQFAGIVHQERNWTYVLVKGAGHRLPQQQPGRVRPLYVPVTDKLSLIYCYKAFVMLREFILGDNRTGLVTTSRGHATVIGGEDKNFPGVLTGQSGIYYGSGTTQFTYTYPASVIGAWETFIAEATASLFTPTSHHVAAETSG